jgi:dTDP-4-amino-4,6-dideoxygalactose transaminase
MSLVPRFVPPAGSPIGVVDLALWLAQSLPFRDPAGMLRRQIQDRMGARHAFLTVTGRAGLTILFRALRSLGPADRDEVVVPSYTCFSVAASAVRAGLRVRIVDVSPDTLDYDFEELTRTNLSKVLAIVATNLYGLPNDLPALSRFAESAGVFLIDDAAQAMGASIGGRPSGAWGDAGLYSFDKGKNVAAIDGGVVVTGSDQVATAMTAECRQLAGAGIAESGAGVAKTLVYSALLRPWLYWIPNGIPQLELGKTVYTTAFAVNRPARTLTSLAAVMMSRLDDFTQTRVRNANALLGAVGGLRGIRTIRPAAGAVPVYLRLPILVTGPTQQQEVIAELNANGFGATGSYPASLADVPGLRASVANPSSRADGGRRIARQIVTLPTHAFVRAADIERMTKILERVTERSPRICAA